jgi:hypothetical protein
MSERRVSLAMIVSFPVHADRGWAILCISVSLAEANTGAESMPLSPFAEGKLEGMTCRRFD